jgi:hypothetical protein
MSGILRSAKSEDIKIVLDACRSRQALISRKQNKRTERLLQQVWRTSFDRLQAAIVEHIELRRKVFCKHGDDGVILDGCFEANITIFDGLNVYVEIKIRQQTIVILAAHSHYTASLLPQ